jgi:hypothetical protein
MKMPIQVWKSIRRIQREFLWGGTRRGTKISWIKWDVVCLPKNKGGLGVRDVRVVNISLLAKWRWRLLTNDFAVWKEVIKSKYGDMVVGKPMVVNNCIPWYSSLWWKDVCSIGTNLNNNWFAQNVVKKLGNGTLTSFWEDTWVGNLPLKDLFPRLFSISTQKEATVAELYANNENGHWNFTWRRSFFVWEDELLDQLRDMINPVNLSEVVDRWGWLPENGDTYTVKSTFSLVSGLSCLNLHLHPWYSAAFSCIWKCPAPSKVSAFAWKLLHDRIPTRLNLHRRRIIDTTGDLSCGLCGDTAESTLHLFIYCDFAMKVWSAIFEWLRLPFTLPHNLFSVLNFLSLSRGKKLNKGLAMIWNGVVWSLWRRRNAVLFDNGRRETVEVIEEIKVMTWKWWLSQSKVSHCLLYEWYMEPMLCMAR